jgi:NAD(P)-dependent dehydrogenase (short-subunit alcohol dehydrogenase family)
MTRTHRVATSARAAIVTGASSGIGRAVALTLAERGFDIGITWSRNAVGGAKTTAAIEATGQRAASTQLDLREPDAIGPALRQLADELGDVEALVCNAGTNRRAPALDETERAWADVFAVNLTAPWLCARAVAPRMIERGAGGRIVFVTSILALEPLAGGGAYCASKAGLDALARVLALELAPYGVLVNTVAPGHTATPMNFGDDVPDAYATDRPVIPLGRPADPVEIAAAVAFLTSLEASYVTGSTLLVDGGLRLVSGPESLQQATGLPPERDQPEMGS